MQNSIETRGNLCNELGWPVTVLAYESLRATKLFAVLTRMRKWGICILVAAQWDFVKAGGEQYKLSTEGKNEIKTTNSKLLCKIHIGRVYGIYARVVDESEIEQVSAANKWDLWDKNTGCVCSWFNKGSFGHWELGIGKLLFGGHSSKSLHCSICSNAQCPITKASFFNLAVYRTPALSM